MKHEGNVQKARKTFLSEKKTSNLYFLLKNRFIWMNSFILSEDHGLEIGCGTGCSKSFIKCENYKLSDFASYEWLDFKNVNAIDTRFPNETFNFIVSSNMIHHIPYPKKFLLEMHRILKPNGLLLIQEINGSLMTRAILRIMRHEGYDYDVNVFDENEICTDPNDLWSANCVIPNLLFDNKSKFNQEIPFFTFEYSSFSEFFIFLNSGGVIAKTFFVPLPKTLLHITKEVDEILVKIFPKVFALQRQIVLRKV